MIENMTELEKLTIIFQGFLKIACNFAPVILLGLIAFSIVTLIERAK